MASVNQTRPHCVNQMGKTHSIPLAARHGRGTAWAWHGRGTAWARHAMCESAFRKTRSIIPMQFGDRNNTNVIPNEQLRAARSFYSLPRCDGDQSE